jgi:hypothetical protein
VLAASTLLLVGLALQVLQRELVNDLLGVLGQVHPVVHRLASQCLEKLEGLNAD